MDKEVRLAKIDTEQNAIYSKSIIEYIKIIFKQYAFLLLQ